MPILPPLPSYEMRVAAGKAQRGACSRSDHAAPGVFERDPVELITSTSQGRLERLVPLRYGRMIADPFAFYRGTAVLQAADLATAPSSGIVVQACGDCHLSNFGGYGTPERQVAFDITDFDETWPAPFEWDIKRLAASFVVAARHLRLGNDAGQQAALEVVASYRDHMAEFARWSETAIWYEHITLQSLAETASTRDTRDRLERGMARAQKRGHEELLPKMGEKIDGRWVLRDNLPTVFHLHGPNTLLTADDDWAGLSGYGDILQAFYAEYSTTLLSDRLVLLQRHRIQDVAFKVVGVGSVGLRCLVLLLTDGQENPLFLQAKEASPSVLAGRAPTAHNVTHQGRRIVEGQRLIQASSDIFLGWASGPSGRPFYIRQLRDMKISAELATFEKENLASYARICGRILARAHAKGSGKAPEITGYIGKNDAFGDAVGAYAVAYADQVERDFDRFATACRQGVLSITTEEAFQQDLVA